jgi:plasmid stability protein
MPKLKKTPLSTFRRRLKRHGIVRVEVQVRKDDAALVRNVANALSDPARETEARALLRQRFAGERPQGLKALLAAAPLEGIDLERSRDTGRDVVL